MYDAQKKVIIGTWPLSGDLGFVNFEMVSRTLNRCFELGFTEFDTAPNYGKGFCESLFGNMFKQKDKIINTKFGNTVLEEKDFSIKGLRLSFEQSLSRLGVDKVNVLFLHNPRDEITDYDNIFELMEKFKDEGKINHTGISLARNHDYGKIFRYFDVIQDDYNLLHQDSISVKDIYKDVLFHARSPLATGILSGKLSSTTIFKSNDYRANWLKGSRLKSILKRVKMLDKLSDIPLPSLARRFILFNDLIDKIIFGVKNPQHVDDIYNDLQEGPLENFLIRKINLMYLNDFGLINQRELSF